MFTSLTLKNRWENLSAKLTVSLNSRFFRSIWRKSIKNVSNFYIIIINSSPTLPPFSTVAFCSTNVTFPDNLILPENSGFTVFQNCFYLYDFFHLSLYNRYFLFFSISRFKKSFFISINESPLEMMKNNFHFMLKPLFVFEIFLFWLFGYVEKWLDKKAMVNFKIYNFTDWTTNNCNAHIARYPYKKRQPENGIV